MQINLYLLGKPCFQNHADLTAQDIPNTKPALLLIYIAYLNDWVSRTALASIFQSAGTDSSVRRYLRVLLHRAQEFPWAQQLEVEAERLRFELRTDVQAFLEAINSEKWSVAYLLHHQSLLEGFSIRDAPALEAWLELERERLQRLWNLSALRYAQQLAEQQNHQQAIEVLERLLGVDPLQEDVVSILMRQYAATAARTDAIRVFERFRQVLLTELNLEPMLDTMVLLEQIRRSEKISNPLAIAKPTAIPTDLLRPPRLIGREKEWLQFQQSTAQIKVFLAEAGAGKTRLLEQISQGCRWYCREGLEGVPYQPIIGWIRGNLSSLPDLGAYREDLARLIPEIAPNQTFGPAEASTAKSKLLEAISRVFVAQTQAIIVDDIQWIDQSSLEALVFIANQQKITVIAAVRKDELTPILEQTLNTWRGQNKLLEIKIEPLSPQELQNLILDVSPKYLTVI